MLPLSVIQVPGNPIRQAFRCGAGARLLKCHPQSKEALSFQLPFRLSSGKAALRRPDRHPAMARIAFILLCHKDPQAIARQAECLTANGDHVAIHFDARAGRADFARLREALAGNPNVVFARRRIRCGWGEWSLVRATLLAIDAALDAFPRATHLYHLSGDCMPVRPATEVHGFLDDDDADHIESVDFFASDWIRTGLREDRVLYRHPFNERSRKRLFYAFLAAQKRLGLRRAVPPGLRLMIGSQWWCLRRQTVEKVMDFARARPGVTRFFRTTWIPDETYFQTLVRHLVPADEIRSRTPTFLMFTDYGMPVTFHDDHYDLLVGQDALFARKISPDAAGLRARLCDLYAAGAPLPPPTGEGHSLHRFLTGRGRIGLRFAPRFWEDAATIGAERRLFVIVCKKWHVAKRLAARIGAETAMPCLEYLFDEDAPGLPALGGIGSTLAGRSRHRRAVLRLLFDHFATDRLAICLDPSRLDALGDFGADTVGLHILDIDCAFSDAYLRGHAQRLGLAGPTTTAASFDRLMPALRGAIRDESDRLRAAGFARFHRIREGDSPAANAGPLAAFLGIAQDGARAIAATEHLFSD